MHVAPHTLSRVALTAVFLATLSACGGGGGGGGGFPIAPPAGGDTPPPVTPPPVTPPPPDGPIAEDDSGAAPSCAGLTTGTYRYVSSNDTEDPTGLLQIKAGLLGADGSTRSTQLTDPSGTTTTLVPIADKPCEFTLDETTHVVFGANGVGMATDPVDAAYAVSLIFPELAGDAAPKLADLNGTFNHLSWERGNDSSDFAMSYGAFVLRDGAITGGALCLPTVSVRNACTAMPSMPGTGLAVVDTASGFTGTGALQGTQAYAFKVNDVLSLVAYDALTSSVYFLTQQRASTLPQVGDISHFWQYTANPSGLATSAITSSYATIDSVDTTAQSVTRHPEGQTSVVQTVLYNAPLPGFRKREPVQGMVSPVIQLSLSGGLTVTSRLGASQQTPGFINLSLSKPAD